MSQLRSKIKELSSSGNFLAKTIYFVALRIYLSLKFFLNEQYRSEQITQLFNKKTIHQTSTYTKSNRYPYLFKICYEQINDNNNTRLLSFGCSTGEEIQSLRKYFKKSIIYGVDINRYCIKQCKRKFKHPKNFFYNTNSSTFKNILELDAIFCLAVFQKSENRSNNIKEHSIYDFQLFEDEIKKLDIKLKKGGLLFIDNCDFDFTETSVSKKYKILDVQNNKILRDRPSFNSHNKKTASSSQFYRIFKKN